MLKFTNINQLNPKKTEVNIRSKNFNEIYSHFVKEKANLDKYPRSYWTYKIKNIDILASNDL